MSAARINRAIAGIGLALLVGGCSGVGSTTLPANSGAPPLSPAPSLGDPLKDKLAQVLARGTLVLSTDAAYPPQSFAVKGAVRAADTKCAANQLTAPQMSGYDVDTGIAVAAALGVEPCFVTPSWTQITSGHWGDRWDVAWGSGAINTDRMTRLYMTQPYYGGLQRFYVRADSAYQTPSDLDGKVIGACADCSHEAYLRGTLEVPGVDLTPKIEDPQVVTYQAEPPGLQEVADGKIDAFLCAQTVGQAAIDSGVGIRALDEAAFPLYYSGFVDRSSGLEMSAFLDRVDGIIRDLHADGTLKNQSMQYYHEDFTKDAAQFDLDSIGQAP